MSGFPRSIIPGFQKGPPGAAPWTNDFRPGFSRSRLLASSRINPQADFRASPIRGQSKISDNFCTIRSSKRLSKVQRVAEHHPGSCGSRIATMFAALSPEKSQSGSPSCQPFASLAPARLALAGWTACRLPRLGPQAGGGRQNCRLRSPDHSGYASGNRNEVKHRPGPLSLRGFPQF
jgi:hypothetical protein